MEWIRQGTSRVHKTAPPARGSKESRTDVSVRKAAWLSIVARCLQLHLNHLHHWRGRRALRRGPPKRTREKSLNTADKLRSSIACAGFVSCIRLFGSLSRFPHKTVHDRVEGLPMQQKPVP